MNENSGQLFSSFFTKNQIIHYLDFANDGTQDDKSMEHGTDVFYIELRQPCAASF